MLKCGHVHHFKKYDKRPEFENVRNFPIPKCICGFKGTLRNLEYSFLSEYPWATLIKFSGKMGGTIAKQGLYDIMHDHPNWELYPDTMAYRTYGYAHRSFSLTFWIFTLQWQKEAKSTGLGLWASKKPPQKPWDWRRNKRHARHSAIQVYWWSFRALRDLTAT